MLNSRQKYPSSLGDGVGEEADIVRRLFADRFVDECPTYILSLDPDLIFWFDFASLKAGRDEIKEYCSEGTILRDKLEFYILESNEFSSEEVICLTEWYLS